VWVDGHLQRDDVIPLVNDRLPHSAHVHVRLREAVFDPADTAR